MWEDDLVQFARLLREILATQDTLDIGVLADSMDLRREEVSELFERAHEVWEEAKRTTY